MNEAPPSKHQEVEALLRAVPRRVHGAALFASLVGIFFISLPGSSVYASGVVVCGQEKPPAEHQAAVFKIREVLAFGPLARPAHRAGSPAPGTVAGFNSSVATRPAARDHFLMLERINYTAAGGSTQFRVITGSVTE